MSPDRGLGELEHLLLFALVALGDGAYGVTVRELIEDETGRAVSPGAVYTGYERLEKRGLVTSQLGDPTPTRGGKPKRHYRLTPRGATALQESHRRIATLASRSRLRRLDAIARKEAR